jgi:Rrf2 family protein
MLTLTRKTEYGLIAMCHLARIGRTVVSARDIAEEHGVPLALLMNVMKKLNRTGLINSVRGAHGGYILNSDPKNVSLARLIECVESPVSLVRCTSTREDRRCGLTQSCTIRRSVIKVHLKLRQFLDEVTIADLAFDEQPPACAGLPQVVAQ